MNEKQRIWVNSESTPLWKLRIDGFRILKNNQVKQFKKTWWKFGRWVVIHINTTNMEVFVLDEAVIR